MEEGAPPSSEVAPEGDAITDEMRDHVASMSATDEDTMYYDRAMNTIDRHGSE
jgi:hypothetical protein